MSKYSDHTTTGGQVIAHRFRMMAQNWNIIGIVGRISFLFSFFFYLMLKWTICDIWNYLCIVKAVYRDKMITLPSTLFSHSYFWFNSGHCKWISDYVVARHNGFLAAKDQFESFLWLDLKVSIAVCIGAMLLVLLINKYFGHALSDRKELISGHDYVDAKALKKSINLKSGITLAKVPYTKNAEFRHTLITGTTGAGKSNVMIELLDQIADKDEKVVLVDTVGTYIQRYYQKGRDIILNPLHTDGVPWSFFNECSGKENNEHLIKNVAECLIQSTCSDYDFWNKAARIVFVETAKKALAEGRNTADFLDILLKIPLEGIEKYLQHTYGYSLMSTEADKMALSIRATLINSISVFDILKESQEERFSIKNWILNPAADCKFLFLSCLPSERSALIPLITSWLSIASASILQGKLSSKRTWFFIDELHNLKRLPNLETSLAEVRKYGGCFVMGTQMISQLNKLYTNEVAKTITGLCGTKIVMNTPEPETAKYMSNFLGEKEEISTNESISYGANTMRDGVNISQKTEKKPTVPYNEIMNLGVGEAFISFPSTDSVAKVKFEVHK